MIQGFFNTVQQDLITVYEYAKNGDNTHNQDQKEKVNTAAFRMLAAFGMGFAVAAAITAVTVFAATTPVGAIFMLASAVAIYAVSHDVFVMAVNSEKGTVDHLAAVATGLIEDLKDMWNGKKDVNDALRDPFTEGTFFRPLWDVAFAQVQG